MKRKNREKTNTSAKIFSGMFFLAGLAVLVLIGISLGKEVYRKRQIQKEIEGLQSQISQMGQQNGDMQNLISYLASTDFQEKQAREKLNLQKSDEKMIVLRKDVVEPSSQPQNVAANPQAPPEDNSPNWQKWWKYFFAT
ncbi:MAG: septum formation initiator family protein [Candidatus Moranbacteria bacterium]|nr:septum formation initiator family protein [Candidatus Moranbacteria bacterium]